MPNKSTLLNYFEPINSTSDHEDLASDEEQQPLDLDLDSDLDFDSQETFFDLPPESFWLPECHEQDWFHLNAVMERKTSKKFISSAADAGGGNLRSRHQQKSFSSRFFWPSVNQKKKSRQLIIGPLNTQKSCLVDRGNFRRNKAGIARLFRSRSEPGGKLVMEASEPGSPRVSCMGRVATDAQTPKKIGIWRSFKSIFRSRRRATTTAAEESENRRSTGFA